MDRTRRSHAPHMERWHRNVTWPSQAVGHTNGGIEYTGLDLVGRSVSWFCCHGVLRSRGFHNLSSSPPSSCQTPQDARTSRPWAELAQRLMQANGQISWAERVELMHTVLGDDVCRQLGVYRLPAGFLLSVVIPVYNERKRSSR